MSLLRNLAGKVANEPVVNITGTLASAATWLSTYVLTNWDPSTHQQEIAGVATAGAYALSFIARQFVAGPRTVKKLTQGQAPVVHLPADGSGVPAPTAALPAPVSDPEPEPVVTNDMDELPEGFPDETATTKPEEPYPYANEDAVNAALAQVAQAHLLDNK